MWSHRIDLCSAGQPRSQGLSSCHLLGRARSLAPGGGKMRDPGNEVEYWAPPAPIKLSLGYR